MQQGQTIANLTPTIEPRHLRSVLGRFATGVTVVTVAHAGVWHGMTRHGMTRHGMTVNSFTAVSLEPPLVLVCLHRSAQTHRLIELAGSFAINILRADHCHISDRFAGRHRDVADRFAGIAWDVKVTGAPILTDALGWLDCLVVNRHRGGDHTIFIGEVQACDLAPQPSTNPVAAGESLVFYAGGYHTTRPTLG